ncbi:MAG: 16S rRNA (cytosine(967)-C(5))-methyltransferase RsmB [Clostridia bacterium]|nr:16S rRNA (cytosine(967)-C(5))-methyltransferase RsmB [Clostridia bacterium]
MTARKAAFFSLKKYETEGKFANIELDAAIKKYGLEGPEKRLYTLLFLGVIEKKPTLDYYISRLTKKDAKISENALIILRLGLYQICYTDKIPVSAAVDESVKLARQFSGEASTGFVNAVLRRAASEDGYKRLPDRNGDFDAYLSVKYSFPKELCALYRENRPDAIEPMLEALSKPTPFTLRVNTLRYSRDEVAEMLRSRGIGCEYTRYSPDGLKLSTLLPYAEIGLPAGAAFVQDEASQMAVCALGAKEGDVVIDACSAPGSKAFGAAMGMNGRGRVLAFDIHKNKLSLIERGAEELGIGIITAGEKNASVRDESLVGTADAVICDVPCSGFGVISKKPDIRYKNTEDIKRLPDIQLAILKNCADYVKPGGTLVYSTCTVVRAENRGNAERFLSERDDFSPTPFKTGGLSFDGIAELWPDEYGTDGFFIAKFTKKA